MASHAESGSEFRPYVPAEQAPAEFTLKAVLLGVFFGILFGAATVYLALRAGLTVSASVPIAVLSIAVFKKLGKSTILENNIVQTIGSAGESVAAGVVFTVPALLFLVRRRALLPVPADLVLAAVGGIARRPVHDPAAARADRQGARQPALPRGHRLRRRADRRREGRQPREDGLRGRRRRAALQVPLRHPRPLERDRRSGSARDASRDLSRTRPSTATSRPSTWASATSSGRASPASSFSGGVLVLAGADSAHLDLRARDAASSRTCTKLGFSDAWMAAHSHAELDLPRLHPLHRRRARWPAPA